MPRRRCRCIRLPRSNRSTWTARAWCSPSRAKSAARVSSTRRRPRSTACRITTRSSRPIGCTASAVRDREGRGRGRMCRGTRRGSAGADRPAQIVRRPRAARRVRAALRVGARGPRLSDPRPRHQSLPAPRRRGSVCSEADRAHGDRTGRSRERHVQPRRRRVHDAARGFSGGGRRRGPRRDDPLDARSRRRSPRCARSSE